MAADNHSPLANNSPLAIRVLSTFRELRRDALDLHTFFEIAGGNVPSQREAVLDAVTNLVQHGLLRERGGDFYSLTESGRLALAGPRDLTLLGRPGCHLCEEARTIVAPMAAKFGLLFGEINTDEDARLRERYGTDVPVLFLGSQEIARHSVDAGRLRDRLAAIPQVSQ